MKFFEKILLGGHAFYVGIDGGASKLGPLTATSITATSTLAAAAVTDYSVSEGIVSASLIVNGGAHIEKTLHVSGNIYLDQSVFLNNSKYIYGKDAYGQTFLELGLNGNSDLLIGYGSAKRPNFDTYIYGRSIYLVGKYTPDGSDTTSTYYPFSVVCSVVNNVADFRVGIGTMSPSHKLHVVGSSMLNGTTYLGSDTTYYLGNGAAASKLYSLTIGSSSSTQLSVTNGGVVTVAASTGLTTNASTYASATGALKVAGSVAIGGQLQLYGGRVYFGGTGHYLEYDSTNNAIHTDIGFYSDSFVTSGGVGSSGEGGGGGVNVNTYSQIQAGNATGVASENTSYVPTAYALRQVYNSGHAFKQPCELSERQQPAYVVAVEEHEQQSDNYVPGSL